jgi:hypothetical protein
MIQFKKLLRWQKKHVFGSTIVLYFKQEIFIASYNKLSNE